MIENITAATPIEIDTELNSLHNAAERLRHQIEMTTRTMDRYQRYMAEGTSYGQYERHMPELEVTLNTAKADLAKVQAKIAPLNIEYAVRGWSRYYIVRNSNGHVHTSTHCISCNKGSRYTDFGWLYTHSGMSEAEIVELAGSGACTFCFPSAPVSKRENTVVLPEVAEARAAKAAKADAKAAEMAVKGIKDIDGGELRVIESKYSRTWPNTTGYGRVVKTERAARNEISGDLQSLAFYSPSHPSAHAWIRNVNHLAAAVAHKTGEDVNELLTAVATRVSRKVRNEGGRVKSTEELLAWLAA